MHTPSFSAPRRTPWALAAALGALAAFSGCSNYDSFDYSVRTQPTPRAVALSASAVQAGAGWAHTCAVLADGTLQCWGANSYGQLGNGGTGVSCIDGYARCSNGPVPVSAPPAAWARVSGGLRSTCALDDTNTAFCWGEGSLGQLGQGAQSDSDVPVAVSGALALGTLSTNIGADLSCGIAGTDLHCWGAGDRGQSGDGSVSQVATAPFRVGATQAFASVAVGELHACALDTTGLAFCWGDNSSGQVGDGSQTDRSTPTATLGGQAYVQITAGLAHTCALDATGVAFCWGSAAQLGRSTTTSAQRATPTAVAGTQRFVAIAAGGLHTCGIEAGGQLWCWGDNSVAQFGNGSTTSSLEPLAITGVPLFAQLIAGGAHTCGITTAGAMFCWGANSYGQSGALP